MAKRPCPSQSPRLQPPLNQMDHTDHLLEAFLALSDSPSSIDLSFDRLLESRASGDADQTLLIDRALRLGSALLGAANRSSRKRASKHNYLAWALPPDLTIKVCDPASISQCSVLLGVIMCNFYRFCEMCFCKIDIEIMSG